MADRDESPVRREVPVPPVRLPEIRLAWAGDMTFVNWISLLAICITDDVDLRFNAQTGIWVSTFDQVAHIGFVHTNISPLAFAEYVVQKKPQAQIGDGCWHVAVDLNTLSGILNSVGKQDRVELCYWHNDGKISFKILRPATKEMDEMISEWEMVLIDKEYDELPLPEIAWQASVTMRTKQLFEVVKIIRNAGDVAVLAIDADGFQLSVDNTLGSARQRVNYWSTKNIPQLFNLKPPETAGTLTLTLVTLMKVGTLSSLAERVQVSIFIDHESPALLLETEFDDRRGKFKYIQAGRTRDDD